MVVALWRDVTDKKAATAAIMRAEQLAALGELAAGVAHEINNPINGIINYAQILVNKTEEGDLEHDIAERLIKEGDRIARIVEGLLSFARRRHEDKTDISIEEILSDSMTLTAAQLRNDNIIVNTDLPDDLPHIKAQAHEIEQVFVNIISNARHALNKKFSGSHADKILAITAETITSNSQPYIRVSFKDNGTGIPAAVIDKVMNPFFSTKTEGKRTGLGLSISHGIVEEHGGRLSIESEEGQYTKVVMELTGSTKIEDRGNAMQLHILVVDDEESIRYTFEAFLSEEGHTVFTAANSDEGIALLQEKDIDLVFADIILPGRTGIDLLKEAREIVPNVPVIMITGAPSVDTRHRIAAHRGLRLYRQTRPPGDAFKGGQHRPQTQSR